MSLVLEILFDLHFCVLTTHENELSAPQAYAGPAPFFASPGRPQIPSGLPRAARRIRCPPVLPVDSSRPPGDPHSAWLAAPLPPNLQIPPNSTHCACHSLPASYSSSRHQRWSTVAPRARARNRYYPLVLRFPPRSYIANPATLRRPSVPRTTISFIPTDRTPRPAG